MFEGKNKTIVLEEEKIEIILSILKGWVCTKRGIPFAKFHKNVCKVHHTPKGVPAVKALLTPVNKLLGIKL